MKIKMALKIWLAIYPSITLFLWGLGPTLNAFPLAIKTLILTLILVPWVVFAGVPLVDFLERSWFKHEKK